MTKRDREHALLMKLQNDHGYMFGDMPRKNERLTMHFRRNRKTGKFTLTPARVMSMSAPTSSWLADSMDALAKATTKKATRARRRAVSRSSPPAPASSSDRSRSRR